MSKMIGGKRKLLIGYKTEGCTLEFFPFKEYIRAVTKAIYTLVISIQ